MYLFIIGQCLEIFYLWTPINSVISIFSKIREDIPNERCTNGVIDTGGIYIDRGDTDGNRPTVSMMPAALTVSTMPPAVKSSTPQIEHL